MLSGEMALFQVEGFVEEGLGVDAANWGCSIDNATEDRLHIMNWSQT